MISTVRLPGYEAIAASRTSGSTKTCRHAYPLRTQMKFTNFLFTHVTAVIPDSNSGTGSRRERKQHISPWEHHYPAARDQLVNIVHHMNYLTPCKPIKMAVIVYDVINAHLYITGHRILSEMIGSGFNTESVYTAVESVSVVHTRLAIASAPC